MNSTIDSFINDAELAIVGASPNSSNFGLALVKELTKVGKKVIPVNPNYEEVHGIKTVAKVADLPDQIENVILTVNPERAIEICKQCADAGIKRVWLQQGLGKGAFSEQSLEILKKNNIEYVYGFCPMMFLGNGIHKFHFWMRRNLGKKPIEFSMN